MTSQFIAIVVADNHQVAPVAAAGIQGSPGLDTAAAVPALVAGRAAASDLVAAAGIALAAVAAGSHTDRRGCSR